MKNIKCLITLLLLLLTVFVLVSCKPEEGPDGPDTSNESLPGDTEIVLYENGAWTREIIRSDSWSDNEMTVLYKIRTELQDLTGNAPKLKNDFKRPEESYDSEKPEILFGTTAHEEMRAFYNTIGYGEAAVKVVGNKILMGAYTLDGLTALRNHFETLCEENFKDGRIVVTVAQLEMKKVVSEELNALPLPENVVYQSTEACDFKQSLILFGDGSEDKFKAYLEKLSGFELVNESNANGNYFATYDTGDDLLNVSYAIHDNKIRLIINEDTEPAKWFKKQEVKKTTTPMIIMHGLGWDGTNNQNGLCLLFRLSDGRFLVIDGGFNREKDASDLYRLIKDNTPKGQTPTIAAWFITHAHGDHDGTFRGKFVSSYGSRVTIESVIFNPPAPALNITEDNEGGSYTKVWDLAKSIKGCQIIRCHVGDKYYIGDAEIDMLYTVDFQYPTKFTYYNTCSHIFSLKLGGQRIMVTGDGANTSFGHVQKMFGETLKADIVQVAHHGYGTGVSDSATQDIRQAYTYMSPSLVLWPIGEYGYVSVENKVYNQHLVNLPSVKEIVVARKEDHFFNLPYTPKG